MVRWRVVSTVTVVATAAIALVAFRSQADGVTRAVETIDRSPLAGMAAIKEQKKQGQQLPVTARMQVGDTTVDLEVAQTAEQRRVGLMYRRSLPRNRGMLFRFDSPRVVRFWMKNTLIPLDMIFLRDGRVEKVVAEAPPCDRPVCPTYGMEAIPINQVIELNAGRAAELGIQAGDRVRIEFLTP
ncbi:DUF192 domain-containing protein [Geitlerinema sp. PCC 9228]|jgi:hypothetical protein|uniref:DUF192 domain-containing protein n=1 Tax=Geitlerinema sp. PCC 9228 TaxID=111611 RepID=UPI001FCCCA4E|nr:DUF192 domain-containing protein [Geitlerinema sp. PCC 9228]